MIIFYVFIYPEIFDNFYYLLFLLAIRLFYAVVNVQSLSHLISYFLNTRCQVSSIFIPLS